MVDPFLLALTRTPSSASCPSVTLPAKAALACAANGPVPASHAATTRPAMFSTNEKRGMTTSLDFAYCYLLREV
jgi:hypothetical protein